MLLPYNSDAPLYHPPIATVGLIIVNVLLFVLWPPRFESDSSAPMPLTIESLDTMTDEQFEALARQVAQIDLHPDWRMLHLGNSLRPWQWLTANFMHADFFHLLGNMIFLWGLGLVVEGKLGWKLFLPIYLIIGTLGYGLVQILMLLSGAGNALGASLPIYGVMVLALLWAPLNSLNCFLLLGVRPMLVEVPINWFAGGYLALQVLFFFLSGMGMGSEALHLVGALVALPIGVVMLQRRWVDCEDWDVFSVWKGRHELSRDERRELDEAQPAYKAKVASHQETYLAQIDTILTEQKNPALAWAAHLKAKHRFTGWKLPEATSRNMIRLFLERGDPQAALPAMIEYLRDQPLAQTTEVRLLLAQQLVTTGERPRQALKVLQPLAAVPLTDQQQRKHDKLVALAMERKTEIELEEPTEDW